MDLRQLRSLGAALIRAMRGYGLFGRIGATGSAATFAGPCRIGCGAGEVAIVAAMQRRSEASGVGFVLPISLGGFGRPISPGGFARPISHGGFARPKDRRRPSISRHRRNRGSQTCAAPAHAAGNNGEMSNSLKSCIRGECRMTSSASRALAKRVRS